jgi:tRNA-dihydrouridine synthase B
MIGRAAQGRPWIFREIGHFLATGETLPPPEVAEIREVLLGHLEDLYLFYGVVRGTRMARKHIAWYTKGLKNSALFRARMNQLQTADEQITAIRLFFDALSQCSPRLEYDDDEVALAA